MHKYKSCVVYVLERFFSSSIKHHRVDEPRSWETYSQVRFCLDGSHLGERRERERELARLENFHGEATHPPIHDYCIYIRTHTHTYNYVYVHSFSRPPPVILRYSQLSCQRRRTKATLCRVESSPPRRPFMLCSFFCFELWLQLTKKKKKTVYSLRCMIRSGRESVCSKTLNISLSSYGFNIRSDVLVWPRSLDVEVELSFLGIQLPVVAVFGLKRLQDFPGALHNINA